MKPRVFLSTIFLLSLVLLVLGGSMVALHQKTTQTAQHIQKLESECLVLERKHAYYTAHIAKVNHPDFLKHRAGNKLQAPQAHQLVWIAPERVEALLPLESPVVRFGSYVPVAQESKTDLLALD